MAANGRAPESITPDSIVPDYEMVLPSNECYGNDDLFIKAEPEDILIPEEAMVMPSGSDVTPAQPQVIQAPPMAVVLGGKQYLVVGVPKSDILRLNTPPCNCSIETILSLKKCKLPIVKNDFLNIIRVGKPIPKLIHWNGQWKHFPTRYLDKLDWLTGCNASKKLYCWPCLIFSEDNDIWNNEGFDEASSMHKLYSRHQNSPDHIVASLKLNQQLYNLKIDSTDAEKNIDSRKIQQLRRFFRKIVLASTILLRSQNVSILNNHALLNISQCEYNETFCNVSTLHGDLIKCLSKALKKHILSEIKQCNFYSVALDDLGDGKVAASVRFVSKTGEIVDRFIGIFGSQNEYANLLKDFKKMGSSSSSLTSVWLGRIPHDLKLPALEDQREEISFFHSQFQLISYSIPGALSHIQECREFFLILQALSSWISSYQDEVNMEFPSVIPVRWKEKLVETAYEHRLQLVELIQSTIEKAKINDSENFSLSLGLVGSFKNIDFLFMLYTLGTLFPIVDALFDIISNNVDNIKFCSETLADYVKVLSWMKERFSEIWDNANQEIGIDNMDQPPVKKSRQSRRTDLVTYYQDLFNNIVDVVVEQVNYRFRDIQKLDLASLFMPSCKDRRTLQIGDSRLAGLKYLKEESARLIKELLALNKFAEYQGVQIKELILLFHEKGLSKILMHVNKLLSYIITMPYVTKGTSDSYMEMNKKLKELVQKGTTIPYELIVHANLLSELIESESFLREVEINFSNLYPSIQLSHLTVVSV